MVPVERDGKGWAVPDAGVTLDAHTAALEHAYALIEAAQGEDAADEIAVAFAEATARGWDDVLVLLHYASSFVARYAGLDDSAHLDAMVAVSERVPDPALQALALAHLAVRRVESRRALELTESPTNLLVRAVGLLDGSQAPVVHRAAALIAIAIVSHVLGLWELAMEQYDLAEEAFAVDDDPRWSATVRRQRRAVAYNRIELTLDWASAEAALGRWEAAGSRAAAILPGSLDAVDADWPPSWVSLYRCQLHLLSALAEPPGVPVSAAASSGVSVSVAGASGVSIPVAGSSGVSAAASSSVSVSVAGSSRVWGSAGSSSGVSGSAASASDATKYALGPSGDDLAEAVTAVGEAVRAARDGEPARAAHLADGQADRLGLYLPDNARLLCMSLAARIPGTPAAATAYADALATLRWNARIDQMAGVRDAIAVERRRHEHEQLRHQVVVDDLTGLANRRGYHAYLTGLLQPGGEDGARYAVMMIDVDHFKGVNDTFGHDVGDVVLTRIAQVLAANVRPVDLAARLGGDEFVVVLADTRPGVPEARAEAILDAVSGHPWQQVAAGLAVSISIGVHHGVRQELPGLLADADRKLYDAKNGGRGRVAAHPTPVPQPV